MKLLMGYVENYVENDIIEFWFYKSTKEGWKRIMKKRIKAQKRIDLLRELSKSAVVKVIGKGT